MSQFSPWHKYLLASSNSELAVLAVLGPARALSWLPVRVATKLQGLQKEWTPCPADLSGDLLRLPFWWPPSRALSMPTSGRLAGGIPSTTPEKLISSYRGAEGMEGDTERRPFSASSREMGS